MTGQLRFVLGDQLTRGLASLVDLDRDRDVVLMVEVAEEARYVRHHKQKIAFLLSAMRHFADALRRDGIHVDYVTLDDPAVTRKIRWQDAGTGGKRRERAGTARKSANYEKRRGIQGAQERMARQ
ncbi:MAG: cryptochrome/photolyase family protein [Hyphomicrobiaceae bacterium]|nr:cryptochrome/photolyase family protein [Hyphomicrobiaceae bacterium]